MKHSGRGDHPFQEDMPMDDTQIRAYLLGRAPDDEAARLEASLLSDDEVFATIRAIEDDLFDEYARDRLSPADRTRFLGRYRREIGRLTFAQALAQRTVAPDVVPFKPRVPYRQWMPLAAAAALVVMVGGIMTTFQRTPVRDAVVAPPAAAVTPSGVASAPVVTLTLGTSRAAGNATALALPVSAAAFEMRVRLDPADRFDNYSVELRSSSDAMVWRGDNLHASTDGRELTLVSRVPAGAFGDGTYEVAVRGSHTGTPLEDLGFVTLTLRRSQ